MAELGVDPRCAAPGFHAPKPWAAAMPFLGFPQGLPFYLALFVRFDRHPSLCGKCPCGSRGFEVAGGCPSRWGGTVRPGFGLPSVLRLRVCRWAPQCLPPRFPAPGRQGSGEGGSVQPAPARPPAASRFSSALWGFAVQCEFCFFL